MNKLAMLCIVGLAVGCVGLAAGCGGRSLGVEPNEGGVKKKDAGTQRRDAARKLDIRRPTDIGPSFDSCSPLIPCDGDGDCGTEQWCNPCSLDPCCPQCSACYPACEAKRRCFQHADCGPTQYCRHVDGRCGPSSSSYCQPQPPACNEKLDPVCGCDGKTYENACTAASLRVSIRSRGKCDTDVDPWCEDVKCLVQNDACCPCDAVAVKPGNPTPPRCSSCRITQTCRALLYATPYAYCVQGSCLVADATHRCSRDSDCTLYNDCCTCVALAKGSKVRHRSCDQSCQVPRCQSMGLWGARARCINSRCEVRRE